MANTSCVPFSFCLSVPISTFYPSHIFFPTTCSAPTLCLPTSRNKQFFTAQLCVCLCLPPDLHRAVAIASLRELVLSVCEFIPVLSRTAVCDINLLHHHLEKCRLPEAAPRSDHQPKKRGLQPEQGEGRYQCLFTQVLCLSRNSMESFTSFSASPLEKKTLLFASFEHFRASERECVSELEVLSFMLNNSINASPTQRPWVLINANVKAEVGGFCNVFGRKLHINS